MSEDTQNTGSENNGIKTISESLEPITVEPPVESREQSSGNETRGSVRKRRAPIVLGIIAVVIIVVCAAGLIYTSYLDNQAQAAIAQYRIGHDAFVDDNLYLAAYHFKIALNLDPGIPDVNSELGQIKVAYNEGSSAVRYFNAELENNPDNWECHVALGCLYTLGCVPPEDPNSIRQYLLQSFNYIIALRWSGDLAYTPDPEVDQLSMAAYHFYRASVLDPGEVKPKLGLALIDIAAYKLNDARGRLADLLGETENQSTRVIIENMISHLITVEQNPTAMADQQASAPDQAIAGDFQIEQSMDNPNSPTTLNDLAGMMNGEPIDIPLFPDYPDGIDDISSGAESTETLDALNNRVNLNIAGAPEPSVYPVSSRIRNPETNQSTDEINIANCFKQGTQSTYQVGVPFTMPFTGYEVNVVEQNDSRVIIEENGNTFIWIPRPDVGWKILSATEGVNLTVPPPIQIEEADTAVIEVDPTEETIPPTEETDPSIEETDGVTDGTPTDAAEEELGPEV